MDPSTTTNNNVDRFTHLISSGVIITILSFLPFKEAVRTTVLSRQWQSLWLSSKNVELDERFFVKANGTPQSTRARMRKFITFATLWMKNFSGASLDNFTLRISKPKPGVYRCINFALGKGVKGLGLDFSEPSWDLEEDNPPRDHEAVLDLPPGVYNHKGLSSLRLSACRFDLSKFGDGIIGGLKEVSLGYMKLHVSTISIIVRNCPLLESLSLKRCWDIQNLDINSEDRRENLSLRSLVIDRCSFINEWYGVLGPNLRFLKFSGYVGIFEFEFGREVQEAELDFGLHDNFSECGELLYNLVLSLYSARVLTVDSYMLQVIPTAEECLGMEAELNVRHLILKTSVQNRDLWGISFFIKSCPLLETLTVQITQRKVLSDYESPLGSHWWYPPNSRQYQCILRTLKVVEVRGFKGTSGEMSLVKHLMEYGRILQQVKLYVSTQGSVEDAARCVEALMAAPRVSTRLHIQANY